MVNEAEKPKNPGGQPTKYKPEYVKIAEDLCREKGYTDANLAVEFHVDESTIGNWKRKYVEFLAALKKGKDEFDSRVVEQALLKRATGYSYEETTREPQPLSKPLNAPLNAPPSGVTGDKQGIILTVTKVVTKEIAPDVVAEIFWLKNRQPQRWSDKKEIEHRVETVGETLTEEELLKRLTRAQEVGTGIDEKSIEGNGAEDR